MLIKIGNQHEVVETCNATKTSAKLKLLSISDDVNIRIDAVTEVGTNNTLSYPTSVFIPRQAFAKGGEQLYAFYCDISGA